MISQYLDIRLWTCDSTDVKPTFNVRNGDKLLEVDTSKVYYYNKQTEQWVEFVQRVEADLVVSDIQIGAVEIKDADSDDRVEVDSDGNLSVKVISKFENITFHDQTTEASQGTVFNVGSYKSLVISIDGTSTEREVLFVGKVGDVTGNLTGVKTSNLTLGTGTTGNDEIWEFDIEGYEQVYFPVASVSGGNVTVKGRAVA
jgi:hypothetical protein